MGLIERWWLVIDPESGRPLHSSATQAGAELFGDNVIEVVPATTLQGAVAALEEIATEGTTTDREIAARALGYEDWEHFDRRDI